MAKHRDTNYGLTPEQEDQVWAIYEKTGNVAEVARQLDTTYYHVRTTLARDPIRLHETRQARCEDMALKWEGREAQAAKLSGELMEFLDAILRHIRACTVSGEEFTDLVNTRSHPIMVDGKAVLPRMTPMQAVQWLLETKQMDAVHKMAFAAAKIGEGLKQLSWADPNKATGSTADPSKMTDGDLMRMVDEIKAAGRELPAGVAEWCQAREQGKAS
jgi:hypothetical protein